MILGHPACDADHLAQPRELKLMPLALIHTCCRLHLLSQPSFQPGTQVSSPFPAMDPMGGVRGAGCPWGPELAPAQLAPEPGSFAW